ncbi:MAG: CrcB family protein [Elusimicrobia bacterium]|nr:CrcB family protein [Elusimicrobiota bacterium]
MSRWLSLLAGFVLGGGARVLVAQGVYAAAGTAFPWGTFAVNLSGCFLIGLFNALAEVKFALGPAARLFLMAGFCGAFTTFSTLILETANLAADGQALKALFNYLGSGVLGFLLFRLGAILGGAV